MKSGAVFVDNSTVSMMSRQLYAAGQELGVLTLDASIWRTGGGENGKLTVMVGGDDAGFAAALPVMQCYGARVVHMGTAGQVNRPKW